MWRGKGRKLAAVLILASLIAYPVLAAEYPGNVAGPFFVGSRIYTGAGAPDDGYGIDGDFYVDTTVGDVYNKTAGTWTNRGSIVGPAGPAGPVGNADVLIMENRTGVENWTLYQVGLNKTDMFGAFDINLSKMFDYNLSIISALLESNKTYAINASLRLADDHIASNMSVVSDASINIRLENNRTAAINASTRIADDHILSNRSILDGLL